MTRMTQAEYLTAQQQAEWEAAGPPAPMTAEQGSWVILAIVLLVFLIMLAGQEE